MFLQVKLRLKGVHILRPLGHMAQAAPTKDALMYTAGSKVGAGSLDLDLKMQDKQVQRLWVGVEFVPSVQQILPSPRARLWACRGGQTHPCPWRALPLVGQTTSV